MRQRDRGVERLVAFRRVDVGDADRLQSSARLPGTGNDRDRAWSAVHQALSGRAREQPPDLPALGRADHEQAGPELLRGVVQGVRRAVAGQRPALRVDALPAQVEREVIEGFTGPLLVRLLLGDAPGGGTESGRTGVDSRDDQRRAREVRCSDAEVDRRAVAPPGVISDEDWVGHAAILTGISTAGGVSAATPSPRSTSHRSRPAPRRARAPRPCPTRPGEPRETRTRRSAPTPSTWQGCTQSRAR